MGSPAGARPNIAGVAQRIDILTGTLGKALGGAAGGYISARREIVEWLRQRARPYLFSNTLAPVIAHTSLKALDLVAALPELRERLRHNTNYFRERMTALGFELLPGEHPIVPLMLRDAKLAQDFARRLRNEGCTGDRLLFPGCTAWGGPDSHPTVGGSRSCNSE